MKPETDDEVILRVMRDGYKRLAATLSCQPAVGFVEAAVCQLMDERDRLRRNLIEVCDRYAMDTIEGEDSPERQRVAALRPAALINARAR